MKRATFELLPLLFLATALSPAFAQPAWVQSAPYFSGGYSQINPPVLFEMAPGTLVGIISQSGLISNPDSVSASIRQVGCACDPLPLQIAKVTERRGVLAIIPPDFPAPSMAEIRLTADGATTDPQQVRIVPSRPDLYSADGTGTGISAAAVVNADGSTARVTLAKPARPGDTIRILGTGLGQADPGQVSVVLGGHGLPPVYAGPAGDDSPGQDRIEFQIPADAALPDGCWVALEVMAGTAKSQRLSISKAPAQGPCPNPFDFGQEQLSILDAGGSEIVGQVSLASSLGQAVDPATQKSSGYARTDRASASFQGQSAADLTFALRDQFADDGHLGCRSKVFNEVFIVYFGFGFLPLGLDAGDAIQVTGPGSPLTLTRTGASSYSWPSVQSEVTASAAAVVASTFLPGTYQASGPGSSQSLPFTVNLDVPPGLRLDLGALANPVSRGFTVAWAPDGYSDSDVVAVDVVGVRRFAETAATLISGVHCEAPALGGQLTIPDELMSGLGQPLELDATVSRSSAFRIGLTGGGSVPGSLSWGSHVALPVTVGDVSGGSASLTRFERWRRR